MSERRFTYATTLSFGSEDDGTYSEFEVEVSYDVVWGRPAQTYGPPERCYPADPDEVDDIRLETVNDKPRPWDVAWGFLSDNAFAEMVAEELYNCDHHFARMIENAAEQAAPDPDDERDRRIDEDLADRAFARSIGA